jgi:invasion protein IalB
MIETAPPPIHKLQDRLMTFMRIATAAALCGAMAWPLATFAQDATAPAEPAAPAVTAPENDLAIGKELADTGIGSTYSAAKFDDWDQRCARSGTDADPCQLYQLLKDDAGNAVAEFTVFGLPEGTGGEAVSGATFIAPLETLLTAGLTLQIDAGKPKVYPFAFCADIGCVIRLGFTSAELDAMKKGAKMTATIVPFVAQDKKVILNVSLAGFTKGYEAVNAANVKADAAAAAAAPAETPAPAPAP